MSGKKPATPEASARRYPHGDQPALGLIWSRGMTVSEVARQINVSKARLYHVLRGGCKVQLEVRDRLPELLGVPLDELFSASALEPPGVFTPGKLDEVRRERAARDVDASQVRLREALTRVGRSRRNERSAAN